MFDGVFGPVLIALMRICDVSIGTFRTILVVQGRKYLAGVAGFFEVLIWVFAIRFIFQHLDHTANLFGYAIGYGTGNIIGVHLEQKVGLGFSQLSIISRFHADEIANTLREMKFGVTLLPAEGGAGGLTILICVIPRKKQSQVIKQIETIDKKCFITIQSSLPYRGFFSSVRK